MNFRDTLNINEKGHLQIGGADCVDLVAKFGTPLYVMDEAYISDVISSFKNTIVSEYGAGNVAYASKALSCVAIYKIVAKAGGCCDVVSIGELFTALKGGMDAKDIYFHGNNKQILEIEYAVKNGVGTIVVDNLEEIEIIDLVAFKLGKTQNVLIRVNPGIEAHTHKFIQTSKVDSKFGFGLASGDAKIAIDSIIDHKNLNFKGLHCHIGSQIFDKKPFSLAVDIMTDFISKLESENIFVAELNMGGGFGVYYNADDPQFCLKDYCEYVKVITKTLKHAIDTKGINKPILTIEPGRSVVAEAGITLYSVGNIKEITDVRKYVGIDGGMNDNIRPALYDAKYEACLANRALDTPVEMVSIAGKCCESGDIILEDVMLPKAKRGDIVAVFSTGAYNYSMASNYNRIAVPPIVLVRDGAADYIIKPQTLDDIIRNDVVPERLK